MPWTSTLGVDGAPILPAEDPEDYERRRLWQARILAALYALQLYRPMTPERLADRRVAMSWLFDAAERDSLAYACLQAGWSVRMVRRCARRAVAGEVKWRKIHRQRVTGRSP